MTRAIRLEFRKMRRLRQVLVLLAMVLAVAALSSVSLFSAGVRQDFGDPTARPWESHLMTYTMMAAMTSPILTAVLASRQTDIEHSANGWILAGTAGVTPGVLVRAKLAALSVLLTGGVAVQTALVAGMGFALGIRVPFDPAPGSDTRPCCAWSTSRCSRCTPSWRRCRRTSWWVSGSACSARSPPSSRC